MVCVVAAQNEQQSSGCDLASAFPLTWLSSARKMLTLINSSCNTSASVISCKIRGMIFSHEDAIKVFALRSIW